MKNGCVFQIYDLKKEMIFRLAQTFPNIFNSKN